MAAELVHSATNDKLTEMDWTKNIEICELVACDHRQAKDVIKAIKKRLESRKTNTQLYAVMLLEMLINNIGEPVHKQVVDSGILSMLVKIVKKKSDLPVREKICLLLDAAQSSVCGASGQFPQYYSSYSEQSAGMQYPQRPHGIPKPHSTSNGNSNSASANEVITLQRERSLQAPLARSHTPSESSILQKAGTALEVLRDVLNTIDTQRPEGANDEFTLDLVEQCSFQKQRVMHLAVTSLDEKVVSHAIELNEQLERVLCKHDGLLSMSTSNHFNHEHEKEEEEEEAEQLFRRIRKGKACVRPQDEEDHETNKSTGLMGHGLPGTIINRPLIRPLISEHRRESLYSPNIEPKEETRRPLSIESKEANIVKPSGLIPPPPSKPIEREKFFQNRSDGLGLHGHMRNLSLHSINTSSSHSGSTDFSD